MAIKFLFDTIKNWSAEKKANNDIAKCDFASSLMKDVFAHQSAQPGMHSSVYDLYKVNYLNYSYTTHILLEYM